MIRLQNLCKSFNFRGESKVVADNLNVTFPSGVSIGLLGRNGAGKSTLLRMIAGSVTPDSGRILTRGTMSWPVGLAGGFHQDLTGAFGEGIDAHFRPRKDDRHGGELPLILGLDGAGSALREVARAPLRHRARPRAAA